MLFTDLSVPKKKKEEEEKYVYQKEKKGNVIGSQMEFWGHKRTLS